MLTRINKRKSIANGSYETSEINSMRSTLNWTISSRAWAVQTGNRLAVGTVVMSVVEDMWVVANYKETQVTHLHVGEKMTLTVDGIEDKQYEGKIEAVSEATGSRYSAIPVDNSTGNFVKVRQRIPVRIEFTGVAPADMERFIEIGRAHV